MSVQISYKKQFIFGLMLLIILISIVEVFANVLLLSEEKCAFEKNEIFKKLDPQLRKKMCEDHRAIRLVDEYQPRQKTQTVNINSQGFRGPELSVGNPDDTYRIFVVGGSSAFGAGSTSDQTTIPGYLQEMFNQQNFDYDIEVINAGVGGFNSPRELVLVRDKIVNYDPDLIIIYDGWNDLRNVITVTRESQDSFLTSTPAKYLGNNWRKMCELGNKESFDVIVTLQPIAGFGHKILTKQEFANVLLARNFANKPLDPTIYEEYAIELKSLEGVCTKVADLRGVFDGISKPIYFDEGHVSDAGNLIVAKKLYELIPPIIKKYNESFDNTGAMSFTKTEDVLIQNGLNSYIEYFSLWFKNILSYYKTPTVAIQIWASLLNQQPDLAKTDPFAGTAGTDILNEKFLGRMDLSKQNFENSDLSKSFLSESNLQFANFAGANLSNTQLVNSNLSNANLKNADLTNANIFGADLSGANLNGTILKGTYLEHVNLSKFDLSGKDLRGLNLSDIDFRGFDNRFHLTTGFNLSGKDLTDVDFSRSNLSGQNLKNTILIRTNFQNAILENVDLSGNDLQDINFENVNLAGANLAGANLAGANLTKADLSGASLQGSNLEGTTLQCFNHKICN